MELEKQITLDILDTKAPALSATSDMPVVETRPDSSPEALKDRIEGKEPAVPSAEQAEEAEQTEESATSDATDEQSGHSEAKVPRGVGKRLAELTKRVDDANARAEAADLALQRALKSLEQITGRPAEERAQAVEGDPDPVKPSRAEYSDPDAWEAALLEYTEAKAAHTARREVAAARAEERRLIEESRAKEAQKAQMDAYNARVEKARTKYQDYAEHAESNAVQISIPMAAAILHHDKGPDLQYYLGKNPAEAERIASYTITAPDGSIMPDAPRQIMELGLLAGKMEAPAASPPPVTRAPKPVKPNAPSDAAVEKDPNEMSMEEYARYRADQRRASAVRH